MGSRIDRERVLHGRNFPPSDATVHPHPETGFRCPSSMSLNDLIQFLKKSNEDFLGLFCGSFSVRIRMSPVSQFTVDGQGVDRR